jgi:hypothetical protein
MKKHLLLLSTAAAGLVLAADAQATISFTTFVNSSSIAAAEGQNATIAFNYAGDEFIGSVYVGTNNLQLYSTNLSGGNVQKFGAPITNGFSGEVVVGVSLGQAGFGSGNIYAGAGNQIYTYANNGGSPKLFYTTPDGSTVRQVLFDPGSSFGGNMLVTTTAGDIIEVNSAGVGKVLATVGEDTEGMSIATSAFGKYAGDLLVSSEGSGRIRAISPTGSVSILMNAATGGAIYIPEAETVSAIPLNLGASGSALEGFYVADYPYDIQFAAASQFAGMQGNAIVTQELGSNSGVWELTYNGDTANTFNMSYVGTLPNQSEDGIFVTDTLITKIPPPPTPEPGMLGLMGLMGVCFGGVAALRGRKAR